MKTKVVEIDNLAAVCGHFTDQTDINNLYGCNHPEQGECDPCYADENGFTRHPDEKHPATGTQGKCYSFSCPLANPCERQDLEKYAPDRLSDFQPIDDIGYDEVRDSELVVYHYEDGDGIGEQL